VIDLSKTIPASKAKAHFSELLKRIKERHEAFPISQRGKVEGVLLGICEYESLIETLEILSDREFMKSLERGLADEKEGRLFSHEDVFPEKQKR
jgi:prevent-host-death family protein